MEHDYDDVIGIFLGFMLIVMLLLSNVMTMCNEFDMLLKIITFLISFSVICAFIYITLK